LGTAVFEKSVLCFFVFSLFVSCFRRFLGFGFHGFLPEAEEGGLE